MLRGACAKKPGAVPAGIRAAATILNRCQSDRRCRACDVGLNFSSKLNKFEPYFKLMNMVVDSTSKGEVHGNVHRVLVRDWPIHEHCSMTTEHAPSTSTSTRELVQPSLVEQAAAGQSRSTDHLHRPPSSPPTPFSSDQDPVHWAGSVCSCTQLLCCAVPVASPS